VAASQRFGDRKLKDRVIPWVSKPRNTKCDSPESLACGHGLRFGGKDEA
jgi:hypothetical protein